MNPTWKNPVSPSILLQTQMFPKMIRKVFLLRKKEKEGKKKEKNKKLKVTPRDLRGFPPIFTVKGTPKKL